MLILSDKILELLIGLHRMPILEINHTHELKFYVAYGGMGYDETYDDDMEIGIFIALTSDCLEPIR